MPDDPDAAVRMAGWRACDACGDRPLASPTEGLLSVPADRIDARREAMRRGHATHDTGEPPEEEPPPLVAWEWGHRECFPGRQAPYALPGDAVDTLPKIMAGTLELLPLEWFTDTAWEDAVRRFYAIPFADD